MSSARRPSEKRRDPGAVSSAPRPRSLTPDQSPFFKDQRDWRVERGSNGHTFAKGPMESATASIFKPAAFNAIELVRKFAALI